MSTYNVSLKRIDDAFLFEGSNERGSTLRIDHSAEGETEGGPPPMQVVLMALAGCSGIDVVSILNKSRQKIETFDIEVTAERIQEDGYASFGEITVHYVLSGGVDSARLRRAISLSQSKYCSVAMLLKKGTTIRSTATLNGEDLGEIS